MTTYNGEKYLTRQLDTIIGQTHHNLEVIVCDDSSSDQTNQIIEQYVAKDKRIFSVCQNKNVGLHANLEVGLRMAKGDYIAISDQDDIWRSDKIEKLLSCIGDNIAAFSDSELIDADGNQLGKTILQSIRVRDVFKAIQPLNLTRQNVVSGHALLFHRSLLSYTLPFCPDLIFDHHLGIIASVRGGLAYYPEPLVQHRIHGDNHTNNGILKTYENYNEIFPGYCAVQEYGVNLDGYESVLLNGRALRRRRRHDSLLHNLMIVLSSADGKKNQGMRFFSICSA